MVSHKSTLTGYYNIVWFSEGAITNIIVPSNIRIQYLVTYRRNEIMFIVHWDSTGDPNMQFGMHESGMHYFDPSYKYFTFVNTFYGN